jgi:nitrile hydratase beta subunit
VNGIHDMGGMHGFGRVVVEENEPVFHAAWEKRVLGIVYQLIGLGWANIDAFRHAIERIDPVEYLTTGYYGRWLASAERLAVERGLIAAGDVAARAAGRAVAAQAAGVGAPAPREPGFERRAASEPRFRVGDAVRTRVASPAGHTRLPRYASGRRGVVHRVRPAYVYPDSNAHGRGEDPQHLYSVRFSADELWGDASEAGTALYLDCFEPYLESA